MTNPRATLPRPRVGGAPDAVTTATVPGAVVMTGTGRVMPAQRGGYEDIELAPTRPSGQ